MKKKVFMMLPCIAAVAIAIIAGKKIPQSSFYKTNELLLKNVEALSAGNDDNAKKKYTCYSSIHEKDGCQVMYCAICDYVPGTDTWYCIADECEK